MSIQKVFLKASCKRPGRYSFYSPGNEETQLEYSIQWGQFLIQKGRQIAENPEGNLKTDVSQT